MHQIGNVRKLQQKMEAFDVLELMCSLLVEKQVSKGMCGIPRQGMEVLVLRDYCKAAGLVLMEVAESVVTLCWAATRTAVPELGVIREEFIKKYSKSWVKKEEQHGSNRVNPQVRDRLTQKVRTK